MVRYAFMDFVECVVANAAQLPASPFLEPVGMAPPAPEGVLEHYDNQDQLPSGWQGFARTFVRTWPGARQPLSRPAGLRP